jgi:hypothetical protein
MKGSLLLACFLFFSTVGLTQGIPIPPGIRQADKTEDQTQRNIPPPGAQRVQIDYARARREADELSKLAQTIPSDVDQMAKGMLPKDVIDKLKQIEKLAKHLRRELSP